MRTKKKIKKLTSNQILRERIKMEFVTESNYGGGNITLFYIFYK